MRANIPKIIDALMASLDLSQTALAKRLGGGITQPQISRWRKGQDPERENFDRIISLATKHGIVSDMRSEDVADSLAPPPIGKTVKLKGYVGAGGQAHFYAVSDEDFEEVPAPIGATSKTVAVEIRGKSFGPLMDSWLVYYDDVRSPITEDLIGEVCVVGLSDDRILIKEIRRERDGSYTLLSNSNEDPIPNASVEWAARVTDMKPRR